MKKAAVVVLLLAGVAAVAGEAGIMDGFGNFVADVQAEDELPDNEKAQNESEEVTGEEEDSASKIDTSITIGDREQDCCCKQGYRWRILETCSPGHGRCCEGYQYSI